MVDLSWWDWGYAHAVRWAPVVVPLAVAGGLLTVAVHRRLHSVRVSPLTWVLAPVQLPVLFWLWHLLGTAAPAALAPYALFAGLGLPGWLLHRSSRRDVRETQVARDRQAAQIAAAVVRGETPRYALWLRAFATTDRLVGQPEVHTSAGDDDMPAHLDVESVLRVALGEDLPLIAAGSAGDIPLGAGRLALGEQGWQTVVAALAEKAELIIVVPAANAGTAWEMRWLLDHRKLDRTIFLMPETPIDTGSYNTLKPYLGHAFVQRWNSADHYFDHAAAWDAAVTTAAALGLRLPSYRYEGALFTLDDTGTATTVRPLGLVHTARRVRRLRGLLADLAAHPKPRARPAPPPASGDVAVFHQSATTRAGQALTSALMPIWVLGMAVTCGLPFGNRWRTIMLAIAGIALLYGLVRAAWTYRQRATLRLDRDEISIAVNIRAVPRQRWRWQDLSAVEIRSAPGDRILVAVPAPGTPVTAEDLLGDVYPVAGLHRLGLPEDRLRAALATLSGGRLREPDGRWSPMDETPPAAVEPPAVVVAPAGRPPETAVRPEWVEPGIWLRTGLRRRLGPGLRWLVAAGVAGWSWWLWVEHISGFWEVLGLPLLIFASWALLNRAPSVLTGTRLLVDRAGVTLVPSAWTGEVTHVPWSRLTPMALIDLHLSGDFRGLPFDRLTAAIKHFAGSGDRPEPTPAPDGDAGR